MPHTPAWYPGKADPPSDDDADTLEVLALDPKRIVVLESSVTCPGCGFRRDETMPEDQCVYFYTCTNCQRVLKPIFGDCCVFCSYGTVICPTEQRRAIDDASESIRRYVGDKPLAAVGSDADTTGGEAGARDDSAGEAGATRKKAEEG